MGGVKIMKYYKHKTTGEVYAYENEQDREEYGPAELALMTQTEVDKHLNPVPSIEQLAANARAKRDSLLSECDWTQMPDAPVDKEAWATYRQALRDVPEQAGFPQVIDWPVAPV